MPASDRLKIELVANFEDYVAEGAPGNVRNSNPFDMVVAGRVTETGDVAIMMVEAEATAEQFELLRRRDIPSRVVITEYVDVAKAFFPDGKEPKFVNAVLDHMAHELTPQGF